MEEKASWVFRILIQDSVVETSGRPAGPGYLCLAEGTRVPLTVVEFQDS